MDIKKNKIEKEKRKWIIVELNYFQIAFSHRLNRTNNFAVIAHTIQQVKKKKKYLENENN